MVIEIKNNLSASLEDYLEVIFNLDEHTEKVHCTDIAQRLGVSKPSVTEALRSLKQKKLVNYHPYSDIKLTITGKKAAARVVKKHNVLKSFFTNVLGIENDLAQKSACKTEHALGPEVVSKLLDFTNFIGDLSRKNTRIANRFEQFRENGNEK